MTVRIFFVLLILFSFPVVNGFAASTCAVETAFANGVWTPEPFANDEAMTVSFRLADVGQAVDPKSPIVLYHRDDGLNNLSEVFRLKLLEATSYAERESWMDRFLSVLGVSAKALLYFGPGALIGIPVQEYLLINSFSDAIVGRVSQQTADDSRRLATEFSNGHPVLVVAHSMGNLYTNAAVLALGNGLRRGNLGVVGAGVPAAYLVGDNQSNNLRLVKKEKAAMDSAASAPYVTNRDDRVINILRRSGTSSWDEPLEGNASNIHPDEPGHAFIDIYWNEQQTTGKRMIARATSVISRMYAACNTQSKPVRVAAGEAGSSVRGSGASSSRSASGAATNGARKNPNQPLGQQSFSARLTAFTLPYPNALKDGDSPELPEGVNIAIAKNFPDDRVASAARAFARASLNYWISVANEGWRYDEKRNLILAESQVCLRLLIRQDVKPSAALEASYLRIILAPLTAKVSLFEKFSNADAVASGHPITLDMGLQAACQIAGV